MIYSRSRTGFFWGEEIGEKCDRVRRTISTGYPASFAKLEGIPYSQSLATAELFSMPQDLRSDYDECIQARAEGLLQKWYEQKTPEARDADRKFVQAALDAYSKTRRDLHGVSEEEQSTVVAPINTDPDIIYDRAKEDLDKKEWAGKFDWLKTRTYWLILAAAVGGGAYLYRTRYRKGPREDS